MNYIILDMEWDSAFFVPEKRFINQILQIGAVKLNENFDIVDTFEVTVRSSFSKRVTKRFTELTGITKEMMLSGKPLSIAVKEYNSFVGDNSVTMTWSNSDLYTILENEKTLLKNCRFKMDKYLDLQKFIQNEIRLKGIAVESQISLSDATEMLGVKTDNLDFHTAKDDSIASALLLKHCYNKERFEALIRDTSNPEFYERLTFKAKFIEDFNSEEIPRDTFVFYCEECNKPLTLKGKWGFKNRNFTANLFCENCNKKYIARVSAKKTYEEVKIRKKLILKIPKEENNNEVQPLPEKV